MNRIIIITLILVFSLSFSSYADTIKLKNSSVVIIGKIIEETENQLIIKEKGQGTVQIPKSSVKKIEKGEIPEDQLYTIQDVYYNKAKKVSPNDAEGNLELGLWCFKNILTDEKFIPLAEKHLKLAKKLNPEYAKKVDEKLEIIRNKKAKKIFTRIQKGYNEGYYLNIEKEIFNLLNYYPKSDYAKKAKDILIEIWGEEEAVELITRGDNLPPVALSNEELIFIQKLLKDEKTKKVYLKKCLNKAESFESRAKQTGDKDKKQAYISSALNCYKVLLASEDVDIKNYAHSKVKQLSN